MKWIRQTFRRALLTRRGVDESHHIMKREFELVRKRVGSSVVFALEVRNSEIKVMEHAAHVSLVAGLIAERAGLSEADTYTVQTAAQLHEVGMFAVPLELLQRPHPLSTDELRQVRAQARVSAEVARLAHPPRVARLIERQYEDYEQLAAAGEVEEREVLLAGILRVADVFAAVTWPRPYQDPMPLDDVSHLLQLGSGTRFHPLAVESALQAATV